MTRTAKNPRQTEAAAVKEIRAESIVLVDSRGRECARLAANASGTLLRMQHPASGFIVELRVDDGSSGLTIDYRKRTDTLCAALLAHAEPEHELNGYGVLHLHDEGEDAKGGGSNLHTVQAEQLATLRSFDDWLPTRNDPDDLRRGVSVLRSVHRTNGDGFKRVVAYARAEGRDDGSEKP